MLLVENWFPIDSLVAHSDVAYLMMDEPKIEEVPRPASGTLAA